MTQEEQAIVDLFKKMVAPLRNAGPNTVLSTDIKAQLQADIINYMDAAENLLKESMMISEECWKIISDEAPPAFRTAVVTSIGFMLHRIIFKS
jgi:hypothetical protein